MTSSSFPASRDADDAVPDDGADTRYRRHAATRRRIRYWNAYVKSGGVEKTVTPLGHFRREFQRRDEGRRATQAGEVDADQSFDGNLSANQVVYSLNKKQRWRLMDAFIENAADDDDDDDDASPPSPSLHSVSVSHSDRVRFRADCTRLARRVREGSVVESTPARRYMDGASVRREKREEEEEEEEEEVEQTTKEAMKERRRARVKSGDAGSVQISRRKTPGHSIRCNCCRCSVIPASAEWRPKSAEKKKEKEEEEEEERKYEVLYEIEAPLPKSLVRKRGVTCDSFASSQEVVIRGKRRKGKGRGEKTREREEEEREGERDAWEEMEEEEEVENEYEEEEFSSSSPNQSATTKTLADWIVAKSSSSSPSYSSSPTSSSSSNGFVRLPKSVVDSVKEDDVKPRVRYLAIKDDDDWVRVTPGPPTAPSTFSTPSHTPSPPLPSTRLALPPQLLQPSSLRSTFGDEVFEGAAIPRAFVIDASEDLIEALEAEKRREMANAFRTEGKIPIEVSERTPWRKSKRRRRKRRPGEEETELGPKPARSVYYPLPSTNDFSSLDVQCFVVFTFAGVVDSAAEAATDAALNSADTAPNSANSTLHLYDVVLDSNHEKLDRFKFPKFRANYFRISADAATSADATAESANIAADAAPLRLYLDAIVDAIVDAKPEFPQSTKRSSYLGGARAKTRVVKGLYHYDVESGVDSGCLTPQELGHRVKMMNLVKQIDDDEDRPSFAGNEAETVDFAGIEWPEDSGEEESYCNVCLVEIRTKPERRKREDDDDDDDDDGSKDKPTLHPATVLAPCLAAAHWCCDACWRLHLRQQIDGGAASLTCPEYGCGEEVDLATLHRLAPVNSRRFFLKRLEDRMILSGAAANCCSDAPDAASSAKWCPNPDCGCVLIADEPLEASARADSSADSTCLPVACSCGLLLCFRCLKEQHWPASCRESEAYFEERVKKGHDVLLFDGTFLGDSDPYTAKLKQCPHCKRKMEKGEGCDHMSCSCGKSFCWNCARDFETHYRHDEKLGYRVWVGCTTDKQDLEKVEIGGADDIANLDKGWYARATYFRRYRRVNGWSLQLRKCLDSLVASANRSRRVRYKRTDDILAQHEEAKEMRRRLHRLVRDAFEEVVECLQVLEFSAVAFHFRRRHRHATDSPVSTPPMARRLWFFTSRLVALLNERPSASTDASSLEAEIRENMEAMREAVGAIKGWLA